MTDWNLSRDIVPDSLEEDVSPSLAVSRCPDVGDSRLCRTQVFCTRSGPDEKGERDTRKGSPY